MNPCVNIFSKRWKAPRAGATITLFIFSLCCLPLLLHAQGTSNKGSDFWLAYGNHVNGYGNNSQQMAIYVTSDVSTTVTVEIPGLSNYSVTYPITANQVTTIDVPQGAYLGSQLTPQNRGIHLIAQKPVVAYAHVYNASVSGATLVLPTSALGKEYYSINYTQESNNTNSFSYFFIVAVEDNTQIVITPSAENQNGLTPGQASMPISLNKGEVYQVLGTGQSITGGSRGSDLTGSLIKSVSTTSEPCKKIVVFSGSGKISIGCTPGGLPGSSDNLYQQVYPTSTWGSAFITAPLMSRDYDIYRIVKSDPSAIVKLNGAVIPAASFVNDFYYEFKSKEVNNIEADKPIQVVQYAVTQNRGFDCVDKAELAGDPEMIFLNPLDQTLSSITMYSSGKYAILTHFINVVIRSTDVSSFTIDGVSGSSQFTAVPGNTAYSYAQLSVAEGTHNLSANGGFNAIAYGFGRAESYGYAAGASLVSKSFELVDSKSTITKTGCIGQIYKLQIPLPYEPTELKLDQGNGYETLPLKKLSTYSVQGIDYHVYELISSIRFDEVKNYHFGMIARKGTADGCAGVDELLVDLPVYTPPDARFDMPGEACAGNPVTFTDRTSDAVNRVTKWLWDFGDGTTGTTQNPVHTYASRGDFVVKLTATSESGCASNVFSGTIRINAVPVGAFSVATPVCEKRAVVFTDASTTADGTLSSWNWNFGDGTDTTVTGSGTVSHTFAGAGSYTVTMRVSSDKSCQSSVVSKSVTVNPLPVVDFDLPEVCLADASAQFVNRTTIAGNASLSYTWDFGDRNATAAQNRSTQANASHKYTEAAYYQVSLTATAPSGCSVTVTKKLTVNGSIPQADFSIVNGTQACSVDSVRIRDLSTVDFGNVTKLDIYYDDGNPQVPKYTDETPDSKTYAHLYPVLRYPNTTRTVTIRVVAYSGSGLGTSCLAEKSLNLTLKAVPLATLAELPAICREKAAISLATYAGETTGIPGAGAFSGPGITSSGIFTPSKAGAGTHTITYTYTATNGCTDQKSQTIVVYPTPVVNAGVDQRLLEGDFLQLTAVATGSNLRYLWSPATGLSSTTVSAPIASPVDDITYTVTVTSDQGCSSSDEVFVRVLKLPQVPNVFTPNGDGVNDVWEIKHLEHYPGATVVVYNRNGDRVFRKEEYNKAWDGTSGGDKLPQGTYYYIVSPKNGRKPIMGSVTLLR